MSMTNDDLNKLGTLIDSKLDKLRLELKEEIFGSEKRIVKGIVGFFSDTVIPLIDDKADKEDIERLERKLDSNVDKIIVLKSRVDNIESIPAIAHELKIKRKK